MVQPLETQVFGMKYRKKEIMKPTLARAMRFGVGAKDGSHIQSVRTYVRSDGGHGRDYSGSRCDTSNTTVKSVRAIWYPGYTDFWPRHAPMLGPDVSNTLCPAVWLFAARECIRPQRLAVFHFSSLEFQSARFLFEMKSAILAGIALLAATAQAHTTVYAVWVNEVDQGLGCGQNSNGGQTGE
jgi:hypothetical protein